MNQIPPFIIVDGSGYLYRAYHALPNLLSPNGEPTGAIYGVISMIKKLRIQYAPTEMVVVFDAKGKNFRHELSADYKAHRMAMPDGLRAQIEPIHVIIKAMGISILCVEGVEADDVIATLAEHAVETGKETLISTGDKDLTQLVNHHIFLINTMTDVKLDREGVIDKMGVPPEKVVDYLTLVGDTSDNIKGVDKCGPKTALKWLETYGSLEAVIANAHEITGKIGENLREALPRLPLVKQLVTVKRDVVLPHKDYDLKDKDIPTLNALYDTYGFRSWKEETQSQNVASLSTEFVSSSQRKLGSMSPLDSRLRGNDGPREGELKSYHTVQTAEAFSQLITLLSNASLIAVDTETTSLAVCEAKLVGLSFAVKAHEAFYIPLLHQSGGNIDVPHSEVIAKIKPILENSGIAKVGQNLKYDRSVLKNVGIELRGIVFDTMLASYVLNSLEKNDLSTLSLRYLQHSMISFESLVGKGVNQKTFDFVDVAEASEYGAEDADIALQLYFILKEALEKFPRLLHLFQTIELPLLSILSDMEYRGILLDVKKLADLSAEFSARLAILSEQIYKESGEVFNIDSPKQLQVILFEKLKLPIIKKTPGGQPSTAEPILQELALLHPFAALLMEYRTLSKLKSTYTDKLPLMVCEATGRVHTSYHQASVSTGRLSSSDPNLQNIPAKTAEGRAIQSAFIAKPGYQLISVDYSQIELRIMAHLSHDASLLRAFQEGKDIHAMTASEVFDVPLENMTSELRRRAKAINFGLIYGMSAFGLAKQLRIARGEAQLYIDTYFARYPGVKQYMTDTVAIAKQQGFVETLEGRRLYLPGIQSRNHQEVQGAMRAAINAPMQGTAADIIKKAMIIVDNYLRDEAIEGAILLQIHDELVLEIAEKEVQKVCDRLPALMAKAGNLSAPLEVSVSVG
jgi:DNA polymerase-1